MMMVRIVVDPSMSLTDLEQCLSDLPANEMPRGTARLRIKVDRDHDILTDIWSAIVCGTLCRRADTDVFFSDSEREGAAFRFGTTLAGLACVSTAASIRSRTGAALDVVALRRRLMLDQESLVTPDGDVTQTLVEFDNDFSVSPLLSGTGGVEVDLPLRRKLFEDEVLRFRQQLDLGALRRGGGPVHGGPAGDLGQFLAELHENGFEHGARQGELRLEGTRLLRIRTHEAGDPTELAERCGSFRKLRRYVERTFRGNDPVKLIEASVSDFGPGIVDGFQASPAGFGPNIDRRELLEGLVYDRLTSKGNDPSAGLGIQKALEAAERMHAFVSLRTAEFWLAASFLGDEPDERLVHLDRNPYPPVAGTHWQILWPHY